MDVHLDGLFNQNESYDYGDDYEYTEDTQKKASQATWIPVLVSLVLVMGLLGNVLVLVALSRRRKLWTISDTFILHLSLADLLLLVTLPFWAAQTAQQCGWCLGFFCKFIAAAFNINFHLGCFLLLCISLNHFLSTSHMIQMFSQKVPRLVHMSCFGAWIISVVFTIPDWLFISCKSVSVDNPTGAARCTHNYSEANSLWSLILHLLIHILGFLIPTAILILGWSYILLRHKSKALFRQKCTVFILPMATLFLVFWMPYNITLMVNTIHNLYKPLKASLRAATTGTSALACIHTCLRPLLYFLLGEKFRRQTLRFLRCSTFESEDSLWELGLGEEVPREQAQSEDELKQMTCL